MVNNTTLSAVKSKNRNDGQGISDAQIFHRFLVGAEEAQPGGVRSEGKKAFGLSTSKDGEQKVNAHLILINDHITV